MFEMSVAIKPAQLPECHNVVPESVAVKTVACCWQYVSYGECRVASNYVILDAELNGRSKNKSPSSLFMNTP
jgi:hypothetical protein